MSLFIFGSRRANDRFNELIVALNCLFVNARLLFFRWWLRRRVSIRLCTAHCISTRRADTLANFACFEDNLSTTCQKVEKVLKRPATFFIFRVVCRVLVMSAQ